MNTSVKGKTKEKLRRGEPAIGSWIMIGHPAVAEIMAGEGFDWLGVDLEHTTTDIRAFYELALAVKGTGCDLLARLHSCDPVQAKLVLDAGAAGLIVPSVNTPEQAAQAVAMSRFPPQGSRGVALSRAADFGRSFDSYFAEHNDRVLLAVMLEHVDALACVDAILATPGVDAAFLGPYDLSASMGLPGQLTHPMVLAARQTILEACARHDVAPGIHFASMENESLPGAIADGFRFIACGIDTNFIMQGCRNALATRRAIAHDRVA